MKQKPVVFISSHPIQYFAPLYRALHNAGLDLTVYYCSRHGLGGEVDKEFGTPVKWDIPLLEGYRYRFLKNYSRRPSIYGFFGLFNPGIIRHLYQLPKSLVVIHGWNYATNIIALIAGKILGHTMCLRAETPLSHELKRSRKGLLIRSWILQRALFPWFNYFLYIGRQNQAFYKFYGVPDKKLVFTPYAVDNHRFRDAYEKLIHQRTGIRTAKGIEPNARVILYSGKYIEKKRPLDIIKAFGSLQQHFPDTQLIMMGEGELRQSMEGYIEAHHLSGITLTGFINQQEVASYYAAADIFVMCSDRGETWGLSVNEAMNFHLPIVLSDMTGCAEDLVEEGVNGYIFKTANIDDLADKVSRLLSLPGETISEAGRRSAQLVGDYSFEKTASSLLQLV